MVFPTTPVDLVLMSSLLVVGVAGFCASLVDGVLGMGFGPTSSSILLSSGLSPASASTTVNLAKVASGLVAGVSHWRLNNVDRKLVIKLAWPGALGALIGTTILANVNGDDLRPILAMLLIAVGLRILIRFSQVLPAAEEAREPHSIDSPPSFNQRGVHAAALTGGVTNGLVGAWGPVVTPFLLQRGLAPRYSIGSVNTAEVAVAVVSAGSLVSSLGGEGLEAGVVISMLIGSVIAAPLAARLVRYFPPRLLGLCVSGLLLITQSREIAHSFDLPGSRWLAYIGTPILVAGALMRPRLNSRIQRLRHAGDR